MSPLVWFIAVTVLAVPILMVWMVVEATRGERQARERPGIYDWKEQD